MSHSTSNNQMEKTPELRKWYGILILLAVIATGIRLFRPDEDPLKARIKGIPVRAIAATTSAPQDLREIASALPGTEAVSMGPTSEDDEAGRAVSPLEDPDWDMSAADWIESANLWSGASLKRVTNKLKTMPREQVIATLYDLIERHPFDEVLRDKTVWFARRLNGPELFDFWESILVRTHPRTPTERDYGKEDPPNGRAEWLSIVVAEQVKAITALSELHADKRARALLVSVAENTCDAPFIGATQRLAAVRVMRETDPGAFLKLADSLPPNDPLRKDLAQITSSDEDQ